LLPITGPKVMAVSYNTDPVAWMNLIYCMLP